MAQIDVPTRIARSRGSRFATRRGRGAGARARREPVLPDAAAGADPDLLHRLERHPAALAARRQLLSLQAHRGPDRRTTSDSTTSSTSGRASEVWGLLGRTLTFMVLTVGLATVLGVVLGSSSGAAPRMPGRRLALTLLFTPMVLPPVAVGTFYRLIYDPTFGIINYYAEKLFGQRFDFLGNKDLAFCGDGRGRRLDVDAVHDPDDPGGARLGAEGRAGSGRDRPPALVEAALVHRPAPWQVHPDARHPAADDRRLQDDRPRLPDDARRSRQHDRVRRHLPLPHRVRGVSDGRRLGPGDHHPADRDRLHLDLPLRPQLPRNAGRNCR